jgi:hypothetical protein
MNKKEYDLRLLSLSDSHMAEIEFIKVGDSFKIYPLNKFLSVF